MLEDKLAFQEEEVPSEKEARLGLLTATKNFTRSGLEITFQFIHLTIHEYLLDCSKLSEREQADFLREQLFNDRFRMMLIFLAGITKLASQSVTEVLSTQKIRMYNEVDETTASRKQQENRFELCIHLAHEAQSQLACSALAKSIHDQVLEYRIYSNFKINIISYFISQSDCLWEHISLEVSEHRRHPVHFDTFVNCLQRASSKTSIKRFSLIYCNDKHTGYYPLPEILWSLFKTSIFNDLRYICASESGKEGEILSFYRGPSKNESKLMFKNLEKLEQIYLESIGLNREVTEKSLIPLVKHCKQTLRMVYLNSISIQDEIYGPPLTIDLFNDFTFAIQDSPSIELLHLEIGPIPLYPIEQALEVFGFICLTSRYLCMLKQLRSLSLCFRCVSRNHFSLEEREQEFNMIQKRACSITLMGIVVSEKLRYLRLDSYFLLNSKQDELYLLLVSSQSLKILNIAFNNMIPSPELLKQLTEGLRHNVRLEILKIKLCGVTTQKF